MPVTEIRSESEFSKLISSQQKVVRSHDWMRVVGGS